MQNRQQGNPMRRIKLTNNVDNICSVKSSDRNVKQAVVFSSRYSIESARGTQFEAKNKACNSIGVLMGFSSVR